MQLVYQYEYTANSKQYANKWFSFCFLPQTCRIVLSACVALQLALAEFLNGFLTCYGWLLSLPAYILHHLTGSCPSALCSILCCQPLHAAKVYCQQQLVCRRGVPPSLLLGITDVYLGLATCAWPQPALVAAGCRSCTPSVPIKDGLQHSQAMCYWWTMSL